MSNYTKIEISKLVEAYNNGDASVKAALVALHGEEIFESKITDRIKTFEDALEALGEEHPAVVAYRAIEDIDECSGDIEAYLKLRIIMAALNEGWKPKFTEDEWRYYPWFYICGKEEWEKMTPQQKSRVVGRSGNFASACGGLVCASAGNASSGSDSNNGSRLAFKSEELAKYAGKQFIEIYAEYILS